jgi:excisionase family DNA binding protein
MLALLALILVGLAEGKLTYTIPEVAAALGISKGLGYELARRGEIPVVRLGKRRLVVPKCRLAELLDGANAKDERGPRQRPPETTSHEQPS